jgi:hypothetical protein
MIYLKADDEATFNAALTACGWKTETTYAVDEEGNEVLDDQNERIIENVGGFDAYNHSHSLDIIGTIYVETGETITVEATEDEPEHTYPETAPIDGWHANLLLHGEEMPSELEPFVIEAPSVPVRRFA